MEVENTQTRHRVKSSDNSNADGKDDEEDSEEEDN